MAFRATRLLVFLLTLWGAGCRRQPVSARIDPAIVPLIPGDTRWVAGLRLDKLKDTPFFKKYVETQELPMLDEFQKRTGLDPRKDLWELCAAGNGRSAVVFARGKFGDLFGLEPNIRIEGMRRMRYKGYNMLGVPDYAVMFLQSGVAAVGAVTKLQEIVDNRDKGDQAPRALLNLVATVPASAQAWMVTAEGGSLVPNLPAQGNLANFTRMVRDLKQFTIYADLAQSVKLQAEGQYGDPQAAKLTNDALRGLIGMARLQTPDNKPELLRVYDGIKVTRNETKVEITADAPFDLIDQFRSFLPR